MKFYVVHFDAEGEIIDIAEFGDALHAIGQIADLIGQPDIATTMTFRAADVHDIPAIAAKIMQRGMTTVRP